MKHILLIAILLLSTVTTLAQQPALKEMLNRINMAVSSAPAGQYTLTEDYKRVAPSQKPTHFASVFSCYYKVNRQDSLVGYKMSAVSKDTTHHKMYNGTVLMEKYKRMVTVTDARKNPAEIKCLLNDDILFPFIVAANTFLQKYNIDSLIGKIKLGPDEVINGEKCWKLMPQIDAGGKKKVIASYYVNKTSFLPVKEIIEWREVVGAVTETTVFTHAIDQLKKMKVADSVFTIAAMSDYNQVRQFTGDD